jgi:hypothetical protein
MKPNGFRIYDGPSLIDGLGIVVILTGFKVPTRNAKMGSTPLQTWILRRDIEPIEASIWGDDVSICGDCPNRGEAAGDLGNPGRSCYVNLVGVRNTWLAYQRGNYPERPLAALPLLAAGQGVRIGTYGDPSAVPLGIWEHLVLRAKWHTGYTHQWRLLGPGFARLCMASVDSEEERREARAAGWRTFRTRSRESALGVYEVICPASAEAGKVSTCEECRACGGLEAKAKADIAIIAHGSPSRAANLERRLQGLPPSHRVGALPSGAGRRARP